MTAAVELPIWAFILILAFAGVTFASHFLFPSVRWFLRRRAERVVARLNKRLTRPIEPFKLLKRQDTIQRLVYDPKVIEAVGEYAQEHNVREDVAFEVAKRYAREVVPSFSASTYFGFATRIARSLSRSFYRVSAGEMPAEVRAALESDAAVVFVVNHRSNMDYVLVIHLAAERSALSFAAGEWARVWPLRMLVRGAGAYFVRRKSRNALYRRVMARYVQMATRAGVAQAIFPEGGLSLDGKVGLPKLGLLSYVVDGFDAEKHCDVVFVPVAVNYDRVLEDRVLVRANETGIRKFRLRWRSITRYLIRYFWQRLTGRFLRFGYATVAFGAPTSLAEFSVGRKGEPTADLGRQLMGDIRDIMPVTPVPLMARACLAADGPMLREVLVAEFTSELTRLRATGAPVVAMSEGDETEAELAINHLLGRRVIEEGAEGIVVLSSNQALLAYYAQSIAHHFQPKNAVAAKISRKPATTET